MNFTNVLHILQNKYTGLSGVRVFLEESEYLVSIIVTSTIDGRIISSKFLKADLLSLLDYKTFLSNKIEALISQVLSVKSVPKKKALTSYNSIW